MPRTLQLLLCTLLLTLLGAPPASARFLSADPLGHDASMSLYDYCNGDPVNGLDPDSRVGVGANVENDLNSIDSGVNQSSLDQVHDSLHSTITSDDIADAVGGLASGYDQLLGGSGNPVNDAGSSVGSYLDNTVQTGQQSWTVATSSQTTFGQKLEGGAVFASNAVLFGMNLVPGEGSLENDVIGGVERSAVGNVGAAEEIPTTTSAIQIRYNPEIPGGPDPAWSIDTSTFSQGETTANGGIRNNIEFRNQWMELQPESISPSNAYRIQELELSPKIDQTWIESYPEHSDYLGETLIHHHVDQGPIAIPVPASTHVGFGPPWH